MTKRRLHQPMNREVLSANEGKSNRRGMGMSQKLKSLDSSVPCTLK